ALLRRATDAATQAVNQARERYDQGFIGYFELLSAEQELTAVRDDLVQSQTATALAMVNVYKALAGAPEGFMQNSSLGLAAADCCEPSPDFRCLRLTGRHKKAPEHCCPGARFTADDQCPLLGSISSWVWKILASASPLTVRMPARPFSARDRA